MFGFLIGFATCYFAAGTAMAIREYRHPRAFPLEHPTVTAFVVALAFFTWPIALFDLDI